MPPLVIHLPGVVHGGAAFLLVERRFGRERALNLPTSSLNWNAAAKPRQQQARYRHIAIRTVAARIMLFVPVARFPVSADFVPNCAAQGSLAPYAHGLT